MDIDSGKERSRVKVSARIALVVVAAVSAMASLLATARADSQIDRGKYLVTFGGCNDCHTPGYFFGKPDTVRYLGGSDVGFGWPHSCTDHAMARLRESYEG